MTVGEQRGSALRIGSHEGFGRGGGIVGDHGESNAARTGIEIFRVLASRLGLIAVVIDHLDGPDDKNFPRITRLEEGIAFTERNFRLIDLNDPLQWLAIRINHRSPQLLRQKPGCLVGDAELVLQLSRPNAVGMRRHEMRGPEPRRQRQFGTMHRRARRDRGLSATIEAFVQTRSALQHPARRLPQPGQMKPSGQRRSNKNAAHFASSGNAFWNSESERALVIRCPSWRPYVAGNYRFCSRPSVFVQSA